MAPRHLIPRALALLLLVVAGCSDDGSDPTSTTVAAPSTTSPPPGLAPGARAEGLRSAEVGWCFDPPAEDAAEDRGVWVVDCAAAHRYEVYDVAPYEGPPGERGRFPGDEPVRRWAEERCVGGFESFVGVPWTRSAFEIAVWWPSAESWDEGDRDVICAVFPGDTRRVVGSQRGVAR